MSNGKVFTLESKLLSNTANPVRQDTSNGAKKLHVGEYLLSKYDHECFIAIKCPFCDATTVEANYFSMIPDDVSDDEREETTCNTFDSGEGTCEHLAFKGNWGYSGTSYNEKWKPQLTKLVNALYEDFQNEEIEGIAGYLAAGIHVDEIAQSSTGFQMAGIRGVLLHKQIKL